MSKVNNVVTNAFLRQLYLVDHHQDLAANNAPNQLEAMVETLFKMTEVIGSANVVEITSIDEDKINIMFERYRLQSEEPSTDEPLT